MASGDHESHLRSELPTKVPPTKFKESFRVQKPVLRPRAEVHGESIYDSAFSKNLTILRSSMPSGQPELEDKLRFNLCYFDGGLVHLKSAP